MNKDLVLKLFKNQTCSMCGMAFVKGQGKCITADFPDDYMHAHCMKIFKEEQKAYNYEQTNEIQSPVEEVNEEVLNREIYTKGKRANAKNLSV
jgi:hypothetical protein